MCIHKLQMCSDFIKLRTILITNFAQDTDDTLGLEKFLTAKTLQKNIKKWQIFDN